MTSLFENVKQLPPDAILGLISDYRNDVSPDKLDLGIGAYRTEEGKPMVLECVKKATRRLADETDSGAVNKEYLPIAGLAGFRDAARNLVFGKALAESSLHAGSLQALSGTGALRVAFDFLGKEMPAGTSVLISSPTWGNHVKIFRATRLTSAPYRYFHAGTKGLDFDGMVADIRAAPNGSVVTLHACAHNPTGVDPSPEQWAQLADLITEKGHLPVFDSAYQGYASGDLDKDAFGIQLFARRNIEMIVCQSFAKNLGLYGERVGCIHLLLRSAPALAASLSQIEQIIRPMYSNPPSHGARLAHMVLTDPELYQEWRSELSAMSSRINRMRVELRAELERIGVPGTWTHITEQIGMFSFTGLKPEHCERLTKKHHVYLLKNGRISMAGLSTKRIPGFAAAVKEVVEFVN